jgi:hypothetical protein
MMSPANRQCLITESYSLVQDLLRASEGVNLGVDFLPGAAGFDPLGWTVPDDFAADVLWFDALVLNVDRTWRNPNLLVWHQNIWLIDHGAALYFHHGWRPGVPADPGKPFDARDHVLKQGAAGLVQAHARLAPLVTEAALEEAVQSVPPDWFGEGTARDYIDYLSQRVQLMPGVIRA